jgi:hypothetical protein
MDTSTSLRPRTARIIAVGAGLTLAGALCAGPASATPDVSTTVTHETVRLGDGDHGILYFVNKSRADLCTPERLVYEEAFEAWLDGGAVGDPPPEPASSQQGVAEVRRTTRLVDGRAMLTVVGDDVPVEAWLFDGEEGGLDCTATDGPAARLFASGRMDFTDVRRASDPNLTGSVSLSGILVDPAGTRWNAGVNYIITFVNGRFEVKGTNRLVGLG